jgi:hypothetical protein
MHSDPRGIGARTGLPCVHLRHSQEGRLAGFARLNLRDDIYPVREGFRSLSTFDDRCGLRLGTNNCRYLRLWHRGSVVLIDSYIRL